MLLFQSRWLQALHLYIYLSYTKIGRCYRKKPILMEDRYFRAPNSANSTGTHLMSFGAVQKIDGSQATDATASKLKNGSCAGLCKNLHISLQSLRKHPVRRLAGLDCNVLIRRFITAFDRGYVSRNACTHTYRLNKMVRCVRCKRCDSKGNSMTKEQRKLNWVYTLSWPS